MEFSPAPCVSGSDLAGLGTISGLNRHRNRARGAILPSTGGFRRFQRRRWSLLRPAEPDVFHDVVSGAKPVPLLSALGEATTQKTQEAGVAGATLHLAEDRLYYPLATAVSIPALGRR